MPYTGHQHEIHRFLEVAGLVGATLVTLEPRLQVTAADRAEAAAALAEDDRPLVVLHPGANDPRRRWPVERLAVVGSELARKGARLAAAVGTATVAVYWCASLGSYGPLSRVRHRAPTAWRLHCPVCGVNGLQQDCRSSHDASLVADVTTDEVLAEALDLLATETARASAR